MNILTRNVPRQYLRNGNLNLTGEGYSSFSYGLSGMTGGYLPALPLEEGGYLVEDPVTFMQNILIQGDTKIEGNTQIDGNLNIDGELTVNGKPFEGGGAKKLSSLEDVSVNYDTIKQKGLLQYNPNIAKWEHTREIEADKIIIKDFHQIQTPNGDNITSLRRDYLSELWDVYIPDGTETQPQPDNYPVEYDVQSIYNYRPMVAIKAWMDDDDKWETIFTPAILLATKSMENVREATVKDIHSFNDDGTYSAYWDFNGYAPDLPYYPVNTMLMVNYGSVTEEEFYDNNFRRTFFNSRGIVHSFTNRMTTFNGDVNNTGKDDEQLGDEYNKGYTNTTISTSLFVNGHYTLGEDGVSHYVPVYKLQSFLDWTREPYPTNVGGDSKHYQQTYVLDQVELVHSGNKEEILNDIELEKQTIKELHTQKIYLNDYLGDQESPEIVTHSLRMHSKFDIFSTLNAGTDPACYLGNSGETTGIGTYDGRIILRSKNYNAGFQHGSHRDICHFVYPEEFTNPNNYQSYFMLDSGNFTRLMADSSGEFHWTVQRAKFLQNNYGTCYFTNDGKLYLYDYVNGYSGKLGVNADGQLVVSGIEGYYTAEEVDEKFALKENVYTKEEVFTKEEVEAYVGDIDRFYTKEETNDMFSSLVNRFSIIESELANVEIALDALLGYDTYIEDTLDEILEG